VVNFDRDNTMKTQVEFRSSKFPPYEGEEEQINPGLWGKRLAEYLVQKLADRGIETEEIVAEELGTLRSSSSYGSLLPCRG
jgi:hypothetical protein